MDSASVSFDKPSPTGIRQPLSLFKQLRPEPHDNESLATETVAGSDFRTHLGWLFVRELALRRLRRWRA